MQLTTLAAPPSSNIVESGHTINAEVQGIEEDEQPRGQFYSWNLSNRSYRTVHPNFTVSDAKYRVLQWEHKK